METADVILVVLFAAVAGLFVSLFVRLFRKHKGIAVLLLSLVGIAVIANEFLVAWSVHR